jgi:hypothetical protein
MADLQNNVGCNKIGILFDGLSAHKMKASWKLIL